MINSSPTYNHNRSIDKHQNRPTFSRHNKNYRNNFSRHRKSAFQNSTIFLLILQLILRILHQLKQQNPPDENLLDLSSEQREDIKDHFGISTDQNLSVADKDNNNELSIGDVVSVTDRLTGEHIQDITITEADVNAILGNTTELTLDDSQRNLISDTLGINNNSLVVIDSDNSASISSGDEISGDFVSSTGDTVPFTHTIDAEFAADINGEFGTPLGLPIDDINTISEALNINHIPEFFSVLDADNSGRLNAGDVIKTSTSHIPGERQPLYHTISASDMQKLSESGLFNLELTDAQEASIREVFNLPRLEGSSPRVIDLIDNDNDGAISVGDTVDGGIVPQIGFDDKDAIFDLSIDSANHINGVYGSSISLPAGLSGTDLRNELNITNRSEIINGRLDRDGSGQLSEGDVVITRIKISPPDQGTEFAAREPTYYHLTAENISNLGLEKNP